MQITLEGWRAGILLGAMGVLTVMGLVWLGVVLVLGLPPESSFFIE